MTNRCCKDCSKILPVELFPWENKTKGYRKYRCRQCENARMRKDRITNGDKRRALDREIYARNADKVYQQNLKRRYGLSDEQIEYVTTSGQCDICGEISITRKLVVDHCHTTNKNRGILCLNCNAGLGHFKDNQALLKHAADYLQNGGSGFFGGHHVSK